MICKDCLRLIPGFLDGELSEAQSAPLRQHLMDCPECRNAASGEKAFKRWFASEAQPMEVPAGFAARVARRAFAGDTGEAPVAASGADRETPILRFVLRATAAAAVLLLVLSAWVRSVQLPDGNLHAESVPSRDAIIRQLEARKRAAEARASDPASVVEEDDEVGEMPAERAER